MPLFTSDVLGLGLGLKNFVLFTSLVTTALKHIVYVRPRL